MTRPNLPCIGVEFGLGCAPDPECADCIFRLPQMPFTWEFTPLVKKLAEKCVEIDGVVVF